ncbi:MAG: hypothetical protein ABI828_06205 [Actinomycetota bacterium]
MKHARSLVFLLPPALITLGMYGSAPAASAACATQFMSVPIPPQADAHFLTGVAAVGASAWAVGPDATSFGSVVIHWNGSAWVNKALPVTSQQRATLRGVGGSSNIDVWAVGDTYGRSGFLSARGEILDPSDVRTSLRSTTSATDRALALHWDGSSWTKLNAPMPARARGGVLFGMDSVSPTDAWAVGLAWRHPRRGRTLIEHWNGVSLTRVPSPNVGTHASDLFGVTAISTNDVWAVGRWGRLNGAGHALVEHWDGSTWSTVPVGLRNTILTSVSGSSASDVWVVGGPYYHAAHRRPVALHWDGVSWTSEPLPSLPPNTVLFGVTAPSAGDAYAVGAGFDAATGTEAASVLRWNGSDWTRQTSEAGQDGEFLGVAAGTSGVWAVGSTTPDPIDPYDVTGLIETPCQ